MFKDVVVKEAEQEVVRDKLQYSEEIISFVIKNGARNFLPCQPATKKISMVHLDFDDAETVGLGKQQLLSAGYLFQENGIDNIAMLTDEIQVLDVDQDADKVLELLGEYANTAKIVRTSAPDRVALLYKVQGFIGSVLSSRNITPEGQNQPAIEFLSYTRNGKPAKKMVTGLYKDGQYEIIDSQFNVMEISNLDFLDNVWKPLCEMYGTDCEKIQPDKKSRHANGRYNTVYNSSGNPLKDMVLDEWVSSAVFEHFGYSVGGEKSSNIWKQIPGHAGLFVTDEDSITMGGGFKHHSNDKGGDIFDAWHYCSTNLTETLSDLDDSERKRRFKEILVEMGEAVDIDVEAFEQEIESFNASECDIDEIIDYLEEGGLATAKSKIGRNSQMKADHIAVMTIEDVAKQLKAVDTRIQATVQRDILMLDLADTLAESSPDFIEVDLNNPEDMNIEFVIDQLLAVGEIALGSGDSNAGKTFWTLHVGLCAALGKNPFTNIKISKPRTVVYIPGEGIPRLKKRVAGMISNLGLTTLPDNFHIYGKGNRLNLFTGEGVQEFIVTMLEKGINPDFIIFDNFRSLSTGANENAQQDVNIVLNTIAMITNHLNAASFVIHHNNKSGEYSGSTHFKGFVEMMFTFKSIQESVPKYTVVDHGKARDGNDIPKHGYVIRDNSIGPYVEEYYLSGRDDGKAGAPLVDQIYNAMLEHETDQEWFTAKDIVKILGDDVEGSKGKSNISNKRTRMNELVEAGKLEVDESGKSKRFRTIKDKPF